MTKLTNHSGRRLGIPGRSVVIVAPGETVEITEHQHEDLMANKTALRWLNSGSLELDTYSAPESLDSPESSERDESLPDDITGEGVELCHTGRGWYTVYVNGFLVTDTKLRKEDAEVVMKDYE